MKFEREKITIYRWWCHQLKEIPIDNIADLEEAAMERILDMETQGYTGGDLLTYLEIDDIEYEIKGWWDVKMRTT